jgi:hypothetical protein
LLRQDYRDRGSGKDLLLNHAELLAIPPETMEANVQYLYSIGLNCSYKLLQTTHTNKRKKLAWILGEVFDYRQQEYEDRRIVIRGLYKFICNRPELLGRSISELKRNKEKLKKEAKRYLN